LPEHSGIHKFGLPVPNVGVNMKMLGVATCALLVGLVGGFILSYYIQVESLQYKVSQTQHHLQGSILTEQTNLELFAEFNPETRTGELLQAMAIRETEYRVESMQNMLVTIEE
jgi:hypothetical protein